MYLVKPSRVNPGCFMFMIDQSGSMADPFGTKTKADGVADAINRLLHNLVIKCTKSEDVRDYYEIGVIGYGGDVVGPAFAGPISGQRLVKISEVAVNPARVEERKKQVSDGAGGLVEQSVKFPVWFDAVASGGTPMIRALSLTKAIIEPWVRAHQAAYPPIVFNITDGEPTDGDPTPAAEELKALVTDDGNVLLFNCHISSGGGTPIMFPASAQGLDPFATAMFNISSELPEEMFKIAKEQEYLVQANARGFGYNAEIVDIIKFLIVGTVPAQTLR